MTYILGLSGWARSGKDSAAEALIERRGFIRLAFADKLREFLYALDPQVNGHSLQSLVDEHGWEGIKNTEHNDEVRRLLQRLGTEAGRNVLGENVWVDATLSQIEDGKSYVITDVRFPNEADAIKAYGGAVIRISRIGVNAANDHASEHALDNYEFDCTFLNYKTLAEWHDQVDEQVGELLTEHRYGTHVW